MKVYDKTLSQLSEKYRTDKGPKYHNYTEVYEYYFKPLKEKEIVLLELGIGDITSLNREGESLLMFQEYFYNGSCYAIDNNEINVNRTLNSFLCDQTNKEGLESLIREIGKPDIIIDDCSHHKEPTIRSFEILFPLLRSGGLYCIEDTVAPAYWTGWEGDATIWDSQFMSYFFKLVHYINLKNQKLFNPPQSVEIPDWIKQIDSIHFHHSQIIVKKK